MSKNSFMGAQKLINKHTWRFNAYFFVKSEIPNLPILSILSRLSVSEMS